VVAVAQPSSILIALAQPASILVAVAAQPNDVNSAKIYEVANDHCCTSDNVKTCTKTETFEGKILCNEELQIHTEWGILRRASDRGSRSAKMVER
jgi:hypothetical protein